jgi:hypothetical protein
MAATPIEIAAPIIANTIPVDNSITIPPSYLVLDRKPWNNDFMFY